jgi:hypothetical protein
VPNNTNNNNNFIIYFSALKIIIYLQLGTIQNNEASVLESFLWGFWHGRQVIF